MGTFYDVLGVRRDSTADEIKQAYHRLALESHPDKNPSPAAAEKMKEINEAYRVLGDAKLRAGYDAKALRPATDNLFARWYEPRSGGFGQGPGAAADYQAEPPPHSDGFGQGPGAAADYQAEPPPRTIVNESVASFLREHMAAKLGLAFGIAITAAIGTIVYDTVTFFSRERIRLVAAASLGLTFGVVITAAFLIIGGDTIPQKYRAVAIVAFAAVAAFLPPSASVLLLQSELNNKSEAGFSGSVTLVVALSIIYLVTAPDWGWSMTCCALPILCVIAGWLIGRFVGRATWDVFHE